MTKSAKRADAFKQLFAEGIRQIKTLRKSYQLQLSTDDADNLIQEHIFQFQKNVLQAHPDWSKILPPLKKGYVWDLSQWVQIIDTTNQEVVQRFMWTRVTHWEDKIQYKYFQEIQENCEADNYWEVLRRKKGS